MDLGIIIAVVGSTLAIVGTTISMFFWVRSEANADRNTMLQIVQAIQTESKDFHGRLCAIEERRK